MSIVPEDSVDLDTQEFYRRYFIPCRLRNKSHSQCLLPLVTFPCRWERLVIKIIRLLFSLRRQWEIYYMYLSRLTVDTLTLSVCLFVLFRREFPAVLILHSMAQRRMSLIDFWWGTSIDSIYVQTESYTALASLIWHHLRARIGLQKCYFMGGARFGTKREGQKQTEWNFCNSVNLKYKTRFLLTYKWLWMKNIKGKFRCDLTTLNYR